MNRSILSPEKEPTAVFTAMINILAQNLRANPHE